MSIASNAAGTGTRPRWLATVTFGLIAVAILFSRDQSHVLQAELWAEDGWVWYPDAYHQGLASLAVPLAGYFQTLSRLVGLLALALPLTAVPTFFAIAAMIIQAAPSVFLMSARMETAWPERWSRAAFAVVMLVLPNTTEVYANLTNAQWHLAVLSFLVLVSQPPRTRGGWTFDVAVLAVSGLSGPFCILLAPIALARAWFDRSPGTAVRAALVLGTALVQGGCVVLSGHERTQAPRGGGPRMVARIVVSQVLFGAFMGQANMPWLTGLGAWASNVLPLAALAAAAALCVLAALRGPALLRYAMAFAGLELASALVRPQISMTLPQWPLMQLPGIGTRYYYMPMLAWLGVVFTLAAGYVAWLRGVGLVLLAAFLFGFGSDYFYEPRPRTGFVGQARLFADAPPGTRMTFPLLPEGMPPMVLVKKPQ